MATNPVYQFLDDLGTQEMIKVIMEIVNEDFDSQMTNSITASTATDELMPTSKATLKLVTDATELLDIVNNEKFTPVKEFLDSIITVEGLTSYYAQELAHPMTHLTIQFVTGPISSVDEPKDDVLYMQKDNEVDTTWALYVYCNNEWASVGENDYDLQNYWSKDEVNDLISRLNEYIIPLTVDEIRAICRSAYRKEVLGITE